MQQRFALMQTCQVSADDEINNANGWGSCARAPLAGQVTGLKLHWVAPGWWLAPFSVCFDWDKPDQQVTLCTWLTPSIWDEWWQGEFDCKQLDQVQCP